jgi:hypothetical protein
LWATGSNEPLNFGGGDSKTFLDLDTYTNTDRNLNSILYYTTTGHGVMRIGKFKGDTGQDFIYSDNPSNTAKTTYWDLNFGEYHLEHIINNASAPVLLSYGVADGQFLTTYTNVIIDRWIGENISPISTDGASHCIWETRGGGRTWFQNSYINIEVPIFEFRGVQNNTQTQRLSVPGSSGLVNYNGASWQDMIFGNINKVANSEINIKLGEQQGTINPLNGILMQGSDATYNWNGVTLNIDIEKLTTKFEGISVGLYTIGTNEINIHCDDCTSVSDSPLEIWGTFSAGTTINVSGKFSTNAAGQPAIVIFVQSGTPTINFKSVEVCNDNTVAAIESINPITINKYGGNIQSCNLVPLTDLSITYVATGSY